MKVCSCFKYNWIIFCLCIPHIANLVYILNRYLVYLTLYFFVYTMFLWEKIIFIWVYINICKIYFKYIFSSIFNVHLFERGYSHQSWIFGRIILYKKYILFKVLSFRSYDLCLSFTWQMDSTPIEILAFRGDPFIDPFFDICKRLEMMWWKIILQSWKQMIDGTMSGKYCGWGETSQFMSCTFFLGRVTCGRALSWSKSSLSWRLAYFGCFCFLPWKLFFLRY